MITLSALFSLSWTFASHLFLFFCVCLFCVWLGGGYRMHLKRKAPVYGKAPSSSTKKTAHREKPKVKPVFELPLPEYRDYRRVNPYRQPRDPSLMKTKFWNKQQRDVFHMLTSDRKNKFVPNVKSVSLAYMEKHMDYFADALALVNQFGIPHIIAF